MLTQSLIDYAHRAWLAVRPGLRTLGERWQSRLDMLTGDRKTLLELTLGTLPGLDLARVSPEVLLSYVDHGLFLRAHSPYCRDIPEDLFLHYVFYPRINNEEIVDCRPFFYQKTFARIHGLSPLDAAMELNCWCASHMTYESTDSRTLDPMSCYRCGVGRCGEESTFAVSVLRAAGIPARQIYAPWWSHCDDNHAWVEFYADGQWYFFGACEPEPLPNRGWFTRAASRAMAICSRRFFDYTRDGLAAEQLLGQNGICFLDNQTARYAKTTRLTVQVPGAPALVRILVLNMASLREIASLPTDARGIAQFQLGFGSCLVEVQRNGFICQEFITLSGPTTRTLTPTRSLPEEGIRELDFIPPVAEAGNLPLPPELAAQRQKLIAQADQSRNARSAAVRSTGDAQLDSRLNQAGKHASVLLPFLQTYGTPARELLIELTRKDWRDIQPEVLKDFLESAPHLRQLRIGLEPLRSWANAVSRQIPRHLCQTPEQLLLWLNTQFPTGHFRVYPGLWPDPLSLLELGVQDARDRTVLFTAAMRLAGFSSSPDPTDGTPCYTVQGHSVHPDSCNRSRLTFTGTGGLAYGISWSVSRWDQGWQVLTPEETPTELLLPDGLYQLITTVRLPNGTQLARFHTFSLHGEKTVPLILRQAKPEQLLARYPICLPDPMAMFHLRLYLEPGTEPTEHALNELLALSPHVPEQCRIHLFLPNAQSAQNATLCRLLDVHPAISCHLTDYQDPALEYLARALYLEPGVWPLLLLTDGEIGYYSHCGYAVGAIPLALDLYRQLESSKKTESFQKS